MNGKTLVIYRSKTGFTKRYAQWIGEALDCEIIPYEKRNTIRFDGYGMILFGGSFHAGTIRGLKWLKRRLPELAGKKLVVFATGAMPPEAPEVAQALEQNFTEEERGRIKTFYLQGGLCYEKMGAVDKMMMSAFRRLLQKTEKDSERCRMLQSSFDRASRDALLPLTEYCAGTSARK